MNWQVIEKAPDDDVKALREALAAATPGPWWTTTFQRTDTGAESPTMTAEECNRMDHAMLEDKRNDGYSKRACASALMQQVQRQNMTRQTA